MPRPQNRFKVPRILIICIYYAIFRPPKQLQFRRPIPLHRLVIIQMFMRQIREHRNLHRHPPRSKLAQRMRRHFQHQKLRLRIRHRSHPLVQHLHPLRRHVLKLPVQTPRVLPLIHHICFVAPHSTPSHRRQPPRLPPRRIQHLPNHETRRRPSPAPNATASPLHYKRELSPPNSSNSYSHFTTPPACTTFLLPLYNFRTSPALSVPLFYPN